ncbi:MAG: hypothetical protein V4622_08935 [Bacteroidota bacterium]
MKIADLNPDSKLWLYQSSRALNPTEIAWLNEQLTAFAIDWASHGTDLKAAAEVLNPYFIAFAVDLTQANASGCSIDKSVRLVKDLGKELNIDFFNRLKMWSENESGEMNLISFKSLAEFQTNFIFNPLLEKVADLDSKFKVQISTYLEENKLS